MAIYGGMIGGVLTCIVFCRKKKINLLDLTDFIVPQLALGQTIGRLGNFINVEAYGTQTNSFLKMGILKNGNYIEVHPVFLYEMVVTLFIFIILSIRQRKFKGELTYLYFIIYGFFRAILESLRIDSLMLGNMRVSQIFSVILFVLFLSILTYNRYKLKTKEILN